jgi:hypothetical protein
MGNRLPHSLQTPHLDTGPTDEPSAVTGQIDVDERRAAPALPQASILPEHRSTDGSARRRDGMMTHDEFGGATRMLASWLGSSAAARLIKPQSSYLDLSED